MGKKVKYKSVTEKKRAYLHKLLDLILDINGLEARTREETGEKPTAFFCFAGHCANVNIRLYKKGWKSDANPEFVFDSFMDIKPNFTCKAEKAIEELEKFKKEMER